MVDSVIHVLVEKLVEGLQNEGSHVLEFHKQFKTLRKKLQLMQSYIEHVEGVRRKDHNKLLRTVVGELRELLYDAEDIISGCMLFLERRNRASKFKRYCSPSFWKLRYRMGKKLGAINQDIRNHLETMSSFINLATLIPLNQEQLGNDRPTRYPILTKDTDIVGIDNDVKKIKKWVLNPPQGPLHIIGIVSMGGIGKTTLTQKIQNDGDMKRYFRHILMVTVSQTFQFEESIKVMLKKISGPRDFANINFQDLLHELQDIMERKKCLVILDDVWRLDEGLWWESLKAVLVHSSSCVIVTTRDVDVARLMGVTETRTHHARPLSAKDSWSLFMKTTFSMEGGQCTNSELENIGREIVDRCGGLPLAIKVVGRMMINKGSSAKEWERISKNLSEELDKKGEPIFSILQLSYDELPSHLKPCMLCLAVYPEDSYRLSEDIIYWWIGEGFVQVGKQGRTAYDIGKEYLDELVSRCLLHLTAEEFFGAKSVLIGVHDMVKEMIRRVAEEENFIWINDGGKSSSIQIQSRRRVGMVMSTDINLFISKEQTNFKSLRTIIGIGLEESEELVLNLESKLCQLKCLKVLVICFKGLSSQKTLKRVDWLSGIGSLQHLVCLQIENSRLERLPDSIGNCQNLQILSLMNCPNLKRLPKNIASLEKLYTLGLLGCESIEFLLNEIGNLRQLSIFSFTVNSKFKDGFRISGLKKLTQISELVFGIDSEDGIEEGELKVLSELTQLEWLCINFPRNNNTEVDAEEERLRLARKVDHQLLSPLNQLSELYLIGEAGEKTPIWLNPTSLPNLRYLTIYDGKYLKHMSPEFFGDDEDSNNNNNTTTVWKLEVLHLGRLYELEVVDWPRMQKAMPFLRLLEVVKCPKLKALPFDLDEDGSGTWRKE